MSTHSLSTPHHSHQPGSDVQWAVWPVGLLASGTVLAAVAADTKAAVFLALASGICAGALAWRIRSRMAGSRRRLSRLLRSLSGVAVATAAVVAIASLLAGARWHEYALWAAAIVAATVPSGLLLATLVRPSSPRHTMQAPVVLAGILTDKAAAFWLTMGGIAGQLAFHVPLALTAVQLVAIELVAQSLPLTVANRSAQLAAHPHRHTSTRLRLVFALLAAGLAYANYLLFFAREHVSPVHIALDNPLYLRATTVALLTLALCQSLNLLLIRADARPVFFSRYLFSNKRLLAALAFALFCVSNIMYNPVVQPLFGAGPLHLVDWLTVVACAGIYLGIRLLQRHMRHHSRHAVLQLHHVQQHS